MERFIGVLIEHFAGAFPLWLAPEQVRILTVSEKFNDYGRQVEKQLRETGMRVSGDFRAEKIGSKIRDAQLRLVPYMLVVGGREMDEGTVAVRDRIDGDVGSMPIAAAIAKLREEIETKKIRQIAKSFKPAAAATAADNEY
jgi:threonyl-tRNA synthetase